MKIGRQHCAVVRCVVGPIVEKMEPQMIRVNQDHTEGLHFHKIQKDPSNELLSSWMSKSVSQIDSSTHVLTIVGMSIAGESRCVITKKQGQRQQTCIPFDVPVNLHLVGYRSAWRHSAEMIIAFALPAFMLTWRNYSCIQQCRHSVMMIP